MELFSKNIFGFYFDRNYKHPLNHVNYVYPHIFKIPSKVGEASLKEYLKKSENKVIYTHNSVSDARNNRLTIGKEYMVKKPTLREKDGTTYFVGIENDAGMPETYSVDFFSIVTFGISDKSIVKFRISKVLDVDIYMDGTIG